MSKKILVIDLDKFEQPLKRCGYAYSKQPNSSISNDLIVDTADLAIRSMLSLLKHCELKDVIKFEADERKARAWGRLRRWLEVTIPVAEMHRNGITDTAKIKIYLTDVLVKMDKLLKGEINE